MIKYIAYCDEDGLIEHLTMQPSGDIPVEGELSNGLVIHHVSDSFPERSDVFVDNYFWRDGWVSKGPRPNQYYYFKNNAWDLNRSQVESTIRRNRNMKLYATDYTQLSDSPTESHRWVTYRQELRDIMANLPADLDDPENVTWPTEPS